MIETKSEYVSALNKRIERPHLSALRVFAKDNDIPIIAEDGMRVLEQIIRMHTATRILEIGTAIGYASLSMAAIDADIRVVTVERDPAMLGIARRNFAQYDNGGQITLIEGDALTIDLKRVNGPFDVLFIDGAKAQSGRFFKRFEPTLVQNGVAVFDNVLFHGLIGQRQSSRNLNQLLRKIDAVNRELIARKDYDTVIYPMGDGLAIAVKKR